MSNLVHRSKARVKVEAEVERENAPPVSGLISLAPGTDDLPAVLPSRSGKKDTTDYIFAPLRSEKREIRLLTLYPGEYDQSPVCDLHIVALEDKPYFEALSYTWGASTQGRTVAVPGARTLPVTDNLWNALKRFRSKDTSRLLWIDALCIDQNNISERNAQVLLMGVIYTSASRVLIWLGDLPERRAKTNFKQCWDSPPEEWTFLKHKTQDPLYRAMNGTSPEWSTRGWTIQEAYLAREALLCFGPYTLTWPLPPAATSNRWHDFFYRSAFFSTQPTRRNLGQRIMALDKLSQQTQRGQHTFSDVVPLLWYAACDTTNPLDSVGCLLGLLYPKEAELVAFTYNSGVPATYAKATYAGICTDGTLDLLWNASRSVDELPGLPTWAMNFANPRRYEAFYFESIRNSCLVPSERPEPWLFEDGLKLAAWGQRLEPILYSVNAASDVPELHSARDLPMPCGSTEEDLISAVESFLWNSSTWEDCSSLIECMLAGRSIDSVRHSTNEATLSALRNDVDSRTRHSRDVFLFIKEWPRSLVIRRNADAYTVFMTESGCLGVVNARLVDNAIVCVLDQAKWPVVLRPTGAAGKFKFISHAYIEGVLGPIDEGFGKDVQWTLARPDEDESPAERFVLV